MVTILSYQLSAKLKTERIQGWDQLNLFGCVVYHELTPMLLFVISGFDYFFVSIKMVLITVIIITSRYDDYNFSMINAIMINMT